MNGSPAEYSAVVLDFETGADLGPIDLSDAKTDKQAAEFAKERGTDEIRSRGIARARIKIARGGFGLPLIEVVG